MTRCGDDADGPVAPVHRGVVAQRAIDAGDPLGHYQVDRARAAQGQHLAPVLRHGLWGEHRRGRHGSAHRNPLSQVGLHGGEAVTVVMGEQDGLDLLDAARFQPLGRTRGVDEQSAVASNQGVADGQPRRAKNAGQHLGPGVGGLAGDTRLTGQPYRSAHDHHTRQQADSASFHGGLCSSM